MTKIKTLSKFLIAGASLSVMASTAHADELSTLKAQLEALQARVDTMQSAPAALPEGTSLMTFRRGSADFGNMQGSYRDRQNVGYEGQGFTIGVTPTADMPAPVAEITVSGYVRSWVIWDIDGTTDGDDAGAFDPFNWTEGDDHLGIDSRGSLSVRSKVDTAIGQIRTYIELRADQPARGGAGDADFRYAWGEWDMTPNWTFGAGSYFDTWSLISAPTTLNGSGPVGPTFGRDEQVRLTYTDGPLSWAVALERPTFHSNTTMPDIATSIIYDVAGGHQFQFVAAVADWDPADQATADSCVRAGQELGLNAANCAAAGGTFTAGEAIDAQDELGWAIGGAMNLNLADVASLSFGALYGEGLVTKKLFGAMGPGSSIGVGDIDINGNPAEAWGMHGNLGFALSDTTSVNIHGGYQESLESVAFAADIESGWTVGANIFWQPVKQMKMGWEVNYGETKTYGDEETASEKVDALQLMWGTQFYF